MHVWKSRLLAHEREKQSCTHAWIRGKRVLAFMLSGMMIISMMPTTALAEMLTSGQGSLVEGNGGELSTAYETKLSELLQEVKRSLSEISGGGFLSGNNC